MKVFERTPLDIEQAYVPQGVVYVVRNRCKGCKICVVFCPQEVLQLSEEINEKGYHYPEISAGKDDACVHCEFCALICPEFAIYTELVEEVTK